MASNIIEVRQLDKRYASGMVALQDIDLSIHKGEIFALLGPNGAGKTTLISILCGIVTRSSGTILIDGLDYQKEYRKVRQKIGLVPQELSTDAFESVWGTVSFSRGLFGYPANDAYLEEVLRSLSLWEKRHARIISLSGGMKRRLLIAKALAHEPEILFLDEPTAGVDVELRKDMWEMVRGLQNKGVTIILTTHYIEEAEEMADRIGIIQNGRIRLVEEKTALLKQLGKKQLILHMKEPLDAIPEPLSPFNLKLQQDGLELVYDFDTRNEESGVPPLLTALNELKIDFKDLQTQQTSLEDIFVALVKEAKQ